MHFVKTSSSEPAVAYLTNAIRTHLGVGDRVLWLVPGGSAIAVAAEVSRRLEGTPMHDLVVSLTDERYGNVDHADSNWRQLVAAGFRLPQATLIPVLTGVDREETTRNFANHLQTQLDAADFAVGLFGMGADGHVAGILPGSPAETADELAAAYDAPNFERVTLTPPALQRLDEAVVYATGEAKWPALGELDHTDKPARFLAAVLNVTIFNDHRGEEV